MSQLIVDLTSLESMELSVEIISNRMGQMGGAVAQVPIQQVAEVTEIAVEEEVVEELVPDEIDDGMGELDDLMQEEEVPAGPTTEDIKQAFKGLATAKGKEGAMAIIQTVFKKLGVKKMDEIAVEKIPVVIQVLEKATTK